MRRGSSEEMDLHQENGETEAGAEAQGAVKRVGERCNDADKDAGEHQDMLEVSRLQGLWEW